MPMLILFMNVLCLRQLIESSSEIAESAFHPEGRDSIELVDEAERKIFAIAEQCGSDKVQGHQLRCLLVKQSNVLIPLSFDGNSITGISNGLLQI